MGATGTAEVALRGVLAGVLGGAGPGGFQSGIETGQRMLGNRAFLQWVGELRSAGGGAVEQGGAAPLQMMPKKRKKPGTAEAEAEPPASAQPAPAHALGAGSTGKSQGHAGPGMTEGAGAAPQEKKKKKKSRVQVALNTLRGEGVGAFAGYIEAEIGEAALLRTLVERIGRAQDLGGVRAGALARLEARLRLLDPLLARGAGPEEVAGAAGAVMPAARQEPELAVIAPARPVLNRRECELLSSCIRGDAGRCARLLRYGNVDVNMADESATLLCYAAYEGHANIVRELLSTPGIDVNLAARSGTTPLLLAAQEGNVEVVKLLLDKKGVNVNLATPEWITPLWSAVTYGWVEVVKLLLDVRDINVNPPALTSKARPLSIAVQKGQEEMVNLLLSAPGIDIDAQKDDGATALYMAAQENYLGIAEQLVRRGADVNLVKDDGMTPLCAAAYMGNIEVVRVLLQVAGIQVGLATDTGTMPLGIAAQLGHKEIVRLLLRKGADPNQKSTAGATPIHAACMHGHKAIVEMLLHAGAAMDAVMKYSDGKYYTLFDIAGLAGQREVMSILVSHRRRREETPSRLEGLPVMDEPDGTTPSRASPQAETSPDTTAGKQVPGTPPEVPQSQVPGEQDAAAEATAHVSPILPTPSCPDEAAPGTGPPTPLAQAKQALRQEVLGKLRAGNFEMLEGIRLLEDVNDAGDLDSLCALYNRLAHIERREERSRRRGRRPLLPAPCLQPQGRVEGAGPAPAAAPVFALGGKTGLDAEAVEDEIKRYLDQAYHRFAGQAVNDMEFGRGKPTAGYPGLLHASAGVAGVGSCSVFYYLDAGRNRIRVVGAGYHLDAGTYRLDYAAEELAGVGRILRLA